MTRRSVGLAATLGVLVALGAQASDMSIELSEVALNQLSDRVGDRSDSGVGRPQLPADLQSDFRDCFYVGRLDCALGSIPMGSCIDREGASVSVPMAEPVTFQWWITDTRFEVAPGSGLLFDAVVRYRVGGEWLEPQRCDDVPARVVFEPDENAFVIEIDPCQVELTYSFLGSTQSAGTVDVSELESFSIPVQKRSFDVSTGSGKPQKLIGSVEAASVSPVYSNDKIEIHFDVAFDEALDAALDGALDEVLDE